MVGLQVGLVQFNNSGQVEEEVFKAFPVQDGYAWAGDGLAGRGVWVLIADEGGAEPQALAPVVPLPVPTVDGRRWTCNTTCLDAGPVALEDLEIQSADADSLRGAMYGLDVDVTEGGGSCEGCDSLGVRSIGFVV